MQHIETVTVGSGGAASITFSNIPQQGFTDLVIKLSARTDGTVFAAVVDDLRISFNGSSANFSYRNLFGRGNTVESNTYNAHNFINGVQATANTFGNWELYIPNYRSSVAKSLSIDAVTENNATDTRQILVAGLWNQTAAITSITLDPDYGNFVQHSTASLYGITAGSDGIVSVS